MNVDNAPKTIWVYHLKRDEFTQVLTFRLNVNSFSWAPREDTLAITTNSKNIWLACPEKKSVRRFELPKEAEMSAV
jgi:hypothetical protein